MIKIGVVGLSNGKQTNLGKLMVAHILSDRAEGYFAAHGCSDDWIKKFTFARGVQRNSFPAHVRVNEQEIDFELHTTQHYGQQGIFAFTTNCDGYVVIVGSAQFTNEKLDALIANILTYEQKTADQLPITIVLSDVNNNDTVRQYAESKNVVFAHIHFFAGIQLGPAPEPLMNTHSDNINNALSALVGRVLPRLGTDRVLKAPAKAH